MEFNITITSSGWSYDNAAWESYTEEEQQLVRKQLAELYAELHEGEAAIPLPQQETV